MTEEIQTTPDVQDVEEKQVMEPEAAPEPLPPAQPQINIDIEKIRGTKIHFCVPCYGGMLSEATFMSFIKWSNTARQLDINWTIETMTNESLISRGRNTLAAKFLSQQESTHLMFVDSDIGWEPWQLLLLIDRDVDVVAGLYPLKTLPVNWVVNGIDGGYEDETGLTEVARAGTGFMLIKRDVFNKLKHHKNVHQYNNDLGLGTEIDQFMYTFFDTSVRDNRYFSEDWSFCANYRDLGGKIYVDKRVLLNHIGTYTFSHDNHTKLLGTYGKEFVIKLREHDIKLVNSSGEEVTLN